MIRSRQSTKRPGTILPLTVLSLIVMCGFVALSVDLGLIAAAKTQCQNAADASAMAGARSLDGTPSQNIGSLGSPNTAIDNLVKVATVNKVVAQTLSASNVSYQLGSWHYDRPNQQFTVVLGTPLPGDNYNLAQVTVNYPVSTYFAPAFALLPGNSSFNSSISVTATATAAHRPRDISIILDYSGSMNNESDLWNNEGYLDNGKTNTTSGYRWPQSSNPNLTSNNTETVYPLFGHYANEKNYADYPHYANLLCPAADSASPLFSNAIIGKCNVSQPISGVAAMVNDYLSNNRYSTVTYAFTSQPDSYATNPLGDNYLRAAKNTASKAYAASIGEILGDVGAPVNARDPNWELDGYSGVLANLTGKTDYSSAPFNGYTIGPRYWGKTFFIWPSDPRMALGSTARDQTDVQQFIYDAFKTSARTSPTLNKTYSSLLSTPASVDTVPELKGLYKVSTIPTSQNWPWPADSGSTLSNYLLNKVKVVATDNEYGRMMRLYNRPNADWRKLFFFKSDGVTPCDDNTLLFQNGYPGHRDPPGNYVINYKAILNWLKNTGQNPFPPQLRAGYITYYTQIPDDVPASAYDHTQLNATISDPNQRFWKEYIDWTLGVWRDPNGNVQHAQNPTCSMGPDYMYGAGAGTLNPPPLNEIPEMNYGDNPWRPRHRLWFGAMTMIQFLSDTGMLPGTAHDISMYTMKVGVGAALTDIENNHPNDRVSMLLFSRPQYANDPPNSGTFNQAQYCMSNDYTSMINALWFPPGTSSQDVRPWDTNGVQTPRAHGDWNANTASSYGFMLAYNQFSSSTDLTATSQGTVGGLGRVGASRLVVYETDGMANEDSIPTKGFNNAGVNNSYYYIRPGDTVNGAGYSESALLNVVMAICNKSNGTSYQNLASSPFTFPADPGYPGYATQNRGVTIHCIAFGAIFENSSATQASSVNLLQKISTVGGTIFPSSPSDPTDGYKWCIGDLDTRKTKLKNAFLNILDRSVPVSLIK
jgi:Flp pilus assembly protein TadG